MADLAFSPWLFYALARAGMGKKLRTRVNAWPTAGVSHSVNAIRATKPRTKLPTVENHFASAAMPQNRLARVRHLDAGFGYF